MRNQYRVTQYNPAKRDISGAFHGEAWTSRSDIGRVFGGRRLTEASYLSVEEAYLFAVEAFLTESKVSALQLRGLENPSNSPLPPFATTGDPLDIPQCVAFARLVLREQVWGKLVLPGRAYVHFGYDYYMYVGLPRVCPEAVEKVQARGLFVEPCRSPYLRTPSGPHRTPTGEVGA